MDRMGEHDWHPDREMTMAQGQFIKNNSAAIQLFVHIAVSQTPENAQLFFSENVLQKYRDIKEFTIIRTDTQGRVSKRNDWSVDYGISAENTIIHTSVENLIYRIPESERDHWFSYMITLP